MEELGGRRHVLVIRRPRTSKCMPYQPQHPQHSPRPPETRRPGWLPVLLHPGRLGCRRRSGIRNAGPGNRFGRLRPRWANCRQQSERHEGGPPVDSLHGNARPRTQQRHNPRGQHSSWNPSARTSAMCGVSARSPPPRPWGASLTGLADLGELSHLEGRLTIGAGAEL